MKPDSVFTSTPVVSISQSNDTVLVTTENDQIFRARKVIMSIPTNMYSEIKFSPPLPCNQSKIIYNTKPGIYAKMIVSYPEPWWRSSQIQGKFTSFIGPICFGWETSDIALEQYSLAFFIAGKIASDWFELPDDEKKSSIIQHLTELVGADLADSARDFIAINYVEWTMEEYLRGAPTSAMGPGMLRKYGANFRTPFGGIHFGGGETAFAWKGYLEGAITAGQRAAREAAEALGAR
jgi:monoamine oxidase